LGKMFGTFILIKTYAMKIYHFTTMRQKNDGEYILLTEEETSQV
jgi:hypothetical protein